MLKLNGHRDIELSQFHLTFGKALFFEIIQFGFLVYLQAFPVLTEYLFALRILLRFVIPTLTD